LTWSGAYYIPAVEIKSRAADDKLTSRILTRVNADLASDNTEVMDRDDNLYSDDRLVATVQAIDEISAPSVLKRVLDSVDEFALGAEQTDDITIVALQYNG
jgi:hypothetical protein